MSKSTHTLNVTKGSTTYTCDLYTTTAEAAVYGASSNLPVNVSGTQLYAPLYPTTFSQTYYDNYGTPVHVQKNNTEYVLATHSLIRLGITAVAHQTISVTPTVNGVAQSPWSSGNKWFPYGTTWTATLTADTGWTKGSLSASSGTLTNANVDVTATAATHKTYTVTMPSTSHQTVKLYYKDYNGSSYATSNYQSTTENKVLGHGSSYYITVTADTGWTAGTVSNAGSSTSPLTLTAARTVSVTAATHKTFVLTLKATTNQTITTKYKNHNGTELASSWSDPWTSGSSDKTKTLGYGSKYYSTIAAATGYTAGTISSPGTSSSPNTLTAAKSISATAASAITPKITITKAGEAYNFTVRYTNTSGTVTTSGNRPSSVTIKYNTTIRFNANTGSSNHDLSIKQGSTYKTTIDGTNTWTSGALTANTTFTVTGIDNTPESSGGEGSGGET